MLIKIFLVFITTIFTVVLLLMNKRINALEKQPEHIKDLLYKNMLLINHVIENICNASNIDCRRLFIQAAKHVADSFDDFKQNIKTEPATEQQLKKNLTGIYANSATNLN